MYSLLRFLFKSKYGCLCFDPQGAQDSEKGGFKKLHVDIPDKFMGIVIGKGYEKLNNISTRTGVTLKAFRGSPGLYFKGSREDEKKAIRQIKAIVVSVYWSPCVIILSSDWLL